MACSEPLLATGACHGATAFVGCKSCRARQALGCVVGRALALRSSSAPAGLARSNTGADRRCPGYRSCHCGSIPGQGTKALDASGATGSVMGRSSPGGDERRGGTRVPRAVGAVRRGRRHADRRAAAGGLGATAGASGHAFGGLRLLARHGWRKVAPDTRHPKSDPLAQEQWKKNSPTCWMPSSTPRRSVAGECA